MNQINPSAKDDRKKLRKWGKIVLTIGGGFTLIGMISIFSSFGSFEPPKYFWCAFIGFPLIFVGGVMLMVGYIGKASRYIAGESAPVAKDLINYLGKNTKDGVSNFTEAIFDSIKRSQKSDLSVEERIRELEHLRNKGLINDEEFNEQKERILKQI